MNELEKTTDALGVIPISVLKEEFNSWLDYNISKYFTGWLLFVTKV